MPVPEIPIPNQEEALIRPEDAEQIQKRRLEEIKGEAKEARKRIAHNVGVHQQNLIPHPPEKTIPTTRIYPPSGSSKG